MEGLLSAFDMERAGKHAMADETSAERMACLRTPGVHA
jgi:hypothetical protein